MLPRDSTASPVKITEGNFQTWYQLTPRIRVLETTKNHRFSYPVNYLHGWFTI
jgi:hypothetical protein